ncbi:EexN family lipoprotein [Bartonella grahamii]|uniref:EexN family lipoprotein n=1 Tax=Bartonella grahamii TaxID=33045 RepID=UPI002E7B2F88|nr:EexN family lipoprotein [Bartonella grahamii]
MNKVMITVLLLCTGLGVAGCEKTYSAAEFKKDKKLLEEWVKKCEKMEPSSIEKSKNCQHARQAYMELIFGIN